MAYKSNDPAIQAVLQSEKVLKESAAGGSRDDIVKRLVEQQLGSTVVLRREGVDTTVTRYLKN